MQLRMLQNNVIEMILSRILYEHFMICKVNPECLCEYYWNIVNGAGVEWLKWSS